MRKLYVLLCCISLAGFILFTDRGHTEIIKDIPGKSAHAEGTNKSMTAAIRFTATPPVIDGDLGDPAWKQADILTGFTVPVDNDLAKDQSEARILFDENRLYVGLKACESCPDLMVRTATSVFGEESFEFFIQPDPGQETYYQVAVSIAEKVYTGKMMNPGWSPKLEVKTAQTGNYWTAEFAMPLSDLGMTAPAADGEKNIRFNICRNDWAESGGKSKSEARYSAFSVLEKADFHVPEMWSGAIMTRKPGIPRAVVNKPRQVNLLANPDFDLAKDNHPAGWRIPQDQWMNGDVSRQETAAMSGEWIIVGKGGAYVVMDQDIRLVPGNTYTVRVKARKSGECALGIQQCFQDGSTWPVLWNCSLTADFRYYYATFKAGENAVGLIFYRISPRTDTDGLEFSSVHLFEGEISPFSIRHFVRTGLERKVEGTEINRPPNFYGKREGKIRILAVAYRQMTSSEYLDVFAGLNVDADILITTGANQDTYYTESDSDLVEQRLAGNQYDVYLIGACAVGRLGEALAKKITANMEKGAGLVINTRHTRGNFNEILTRYKPVAAEQSHYLKKGLPVELYPMAPTGTVKIAQAGKGRIIEFADMGQWEFTSIYVPSETSACFPFPHQRYSAAWLARAIYYASGQSSTVISNVSFESGRVAVNCEAPRGLPRGILAEPSEAKNAILAKDGEGAVDGSLGRVGQPCPTERRDRLSRPTRIELEWQLEDKNGKPAAKGLVKIKDNQAGFTLPRMDLAGWHVLGLWLKDDKGSVLDYGAWTVKHKGPEIAELKSAKEFYTGAEEGEFTVKLKDFDETMTVVWTLEDFAGRILESGSVKAAETVKFNVPLNAIFSNLARLWVYLRSEEITLDARRFPVFLPDRDRARLLNDYNVGVWPEGCGNPCSGHYINRALEMMGVSAKNHADTMLSLDDGLGASAMLQGGAGCEYLGSWYKPPKNNIRQPSLRDPVILKELEDKVKKAAESGRKYGPFAVVVLDEPGLITRGGTDEVDAHPENIKEYRKRMQAKYGTIESFNQRCSTSYKSFDELGMVLTKDARGRTNYAEFVEWRNYNVDTYVEAFRLVSDSYHSRDPDVPVSMQNSFGQRALDGNDYWKLLTRAGFGFSHEYTSMVTGDSDPFRSFDELYRSFRPDMRVWGYIGYGWSREHATFQPWWFALHRYGGFTFFSAAGLDPGEASYGLVDIPGFGLAQKGKLLKDGIAESGLLDGMGRVFLEYDWARRDITVLYSQPSMLVAWCRGKEHDNNELIAGSPYRDYFYSRHRIRYLLEELLYQYDFISPEQILQGKLDSYKALILPHIEALSDSEAEKIKGFMERGGTVIADIMPGTYDDLGTPRTESPFKALKGNANLVFFDNIFNDKDAGQREKMLVLLKEKRIEPIIRCNDAVSTSGREAMRFVKGDMNVYAVTRDFRRSADAKEQQFTFPTEGHLYDLREGRYIGRTNQISCVIPNAGTKVYGHYPYRVTGMEVDVPAKARGGEDLVAKIRLNTSTGKAGHHVFHVEVLPPDGVARWYMKRNVVAAEGKTIFRFRLAENDPAGKWTLRITDVLTGTTATKKFSLL